jgi:deoxyribodipyrimidine photolyase-related protein
VGHSCARLRFILGDQLSRSIATLEDVDPAADVVLMVEVLDECSYVRHHPKKIAFVLSAMRHFAGELQAEGLTVDYRPLDAPGNTGSFRGELLTAVKRHAPQRVVVTEPGEWRVWQDMLGWQDAAGVPVEIRSDGRYLASRAWFARWAEGRRQLRMEFFYRDMRRRTGLLMQPDGEPVGGRWNFDADNRKRLPAHVRPPELPSFEPDETTAAVLEMVGCRFDNHFGVLNPFRFAVTGQDASDALNAFLKHRLPHFGDYQDAMRQGERTLYHAAISPYLNAGLLDPLIVCRKAEAEYAAGRAPLNAVEGFIRQIVGWREYIRGVYWLKMPEYAKTNFLAADRPLPGFYWSGETSMNCLRQCIGQTRDEAYARHIQRLMVIGNFALIAGLAPQEVCEWYLLVYADAYDWVELPNTHGMALFADGGILGSKPYAASGAYINRMSDYCRDCQFDPKQSTGERACPFNYLYWDFLERNRKRLAANQRMSVIYNNLDRMPEDRRHAIRQQARRFLDHLR